MLKQRVFQIACSYEDANDAGTLRDDPALKMACRQLFSTPSTMNIAICRFTSMRGKAGSWARRCCGRANGPPATRSWRFSSGWSGKSATPGPGVGILLRSDSHYTSPHTIEFCKAENLKYALGLAPNAVLRKQAATLVEEAERCYHQQRQPVRLFGEFSYGAGS